MDDVDRKIIGLLIEDGRISVTDLADAVHLGLSATSQRLARLRTSGVIDRFTVRLDAAAVNRPIDAIIDLQLVPGSPWTALDETLQEHADVVDAIHLTGSFDYQIRVRAKSIDELDQLLRWLKEDQGVRETSTRVVLHTVEGFPREALPVSGPAG